MSPAWNKNKDLPLFIKSIRAPVCSPFGPMDHSSSQSKEVNLHSNAKERENLRICQATTRSFLWPLLTVAWSLICRLVTFDWCIPVWRCVTPRLMFVPAPAMAVRLSGRRITRTHVTLVILHPRSQLCGLTLVLFLGHISYARVTGCRGAPRLSHMLVRISLQSHRVEPNS